MTDTRLNPKTPARFGAISGAPIPDRRCGYEWRDTHNEEIHDCSEPFAHSGGHECVCGATRDEPLAAPRRDLALIDRDRHIVIAEPGGKASIPDDQSRYQLIASDDTPGWFARCRCGWESHQGEGWLVEEAWRTHDRQAHPAPEPQSAERVLPEPAPGDGPELDLEHIAAALRRWHDLDFGTGCETHGEQLDAGWQLASAVRALVARVRELEGDLESKLETARQERDEARQEAVRFAAELGFGDNVTDPAAPLADMIDPIRDAMSAAEHHDDCPTHCEVCGETLAATVCQRCHGAGDIGTTAHEECPDCAGAGKVHEGCVGESYADLARERDEARAELATERGTGRAIAAADALRWAALHLGPRGAATVHRLAASVREITIPTTTEETDHA